MPRHIAMKVEDVKPGMKYNDMLIDACWLRQATKDKPMRYIITTSGGEREFTPGAWIRVTIREEYEES